MPEVKRDLTLPHPEISPFRDTGAKGTVVPDLDLQGLTGEDRRRHLEAHVAQPRRLVVEQRFESFQATAFAEWERRQFI